MSVRSPTAGTWSSSQWRPDNEFETDRRRSLDDALVRARPPRGGSGQALRADRDGHSGREGTVMSEHDAFDRVRLEFPMRPRTLEQ